MHDDDEGEGQRSCHLRLLVVTVVVAVVAANSARCFCCFSFGPTGTLVLPNMETTAAATTTTTTSTSSSSSGSQLAGNELVESARDFEKLDEDAVKRGVVAAVELRRLEGLASKEKVELDQVYAADVEPSVTLQRLGDLISQRQAELQRLADQITQLQFLSHHAREDLLELQQKKSSCRSRVAAQQKLHQEDLRKNTKQEQQLCL